MISVLLLQLLLGVDFPICTAESFQDHPVVTYADDKFCVFWADERLYGSTEQYAVYGARVTTNGHVVDPDGKLIFCDSVANRFDATFDGTNLLVVCRNGC